MAHEMMVMITCRCSGHDANRIRAIVDSRVYASPEFIAGPPPSTDAQSAPPAGPAGE
jgi:hypothetical protein